MKHLNENPFRFIGHYGTLFSADRCDFRGGITLKSVPKDKSLMASDIAEMIGHHATNIHPQLNGFQGYDCIDWNIK